MTVIREQIKKICLPNNIVYVAPEAGNFEARTLSWQLKQDNLRFNFFFRMWCMHHRVQSDGGSLRKNLFPMHCWDDVPPFIDIDFTVSVTMVNHLYIMSDNFPNITSWEVYKYFYLMVLF